MKSKVKKIACLSLTAVMAATFAAGNVLAFSDGGKGKNSVSAVYDTVNYENVTGKIDLSGVRMQNFNAKVQENDGKLASVSGEQTVIVTLKEDCILDRKEEWQTAAEYLSTYEGEKALGKIEYSQDKYLREISKKGVKYQLKNSFTTVTNSLAIQVNTSDINKIKDDSSVKSVVFSSSYAYPKAVESTSGAGVTNPNNVYKTGIYNSDKYVQQGIDGGGMTVAILDTGLDYTHDAFDEMPTEVGFTKEYVESKISGSEAEKLSAAKGVDISVDDVYVNAKVPFAYDYADKDADVYPSYSQHGTHVAGIVAGKADYYKNKDGERVDEKFRGVAPEAQLVICKVFTDDYESDDIGGAVTEDILAALEDCILLNVDIINMSLGTSAGFSSIAIDGDTEGLWMNDVYGRIKTAGINLICAASNEYSSGFGSVFGNNLASNPESGTVGSPSTFVGALSVASINGQRSRYMTVETGKGDSATTTPIFYLDSSNVNYVLYDFIEQMLGTEQRKTFKYVVIPGNGLPADYTTSIQNLLKDKSEGKVIALIKRGNNTFQDKIEIATRMGADAVIVYNNVAGTIRMNLGDLDDPIPTVSITMDAGKLLASAGRTGHITLDKDYQAGPFMNDYSSWGTTPDLKLKPDITAHGGEITSTVAGGYDEQSGTSMASPNMAGFAALLRSYLRDKAEFNNLSAPELTRLSNSIIMSTAVTVYDQENLPYSPRKQGAGLATLDNVINTNAYLFTKEAEGGAEDNRPKIELGEDEKKTGEYDLKFYVKNFGSKELVFAPEYVFMTETLSSDGLSVAEKAHLLDGNGQWKVNGAAHSGDIKVAAGEEVAVELHITLNDAEKKYIDESFKNGMFVEGFVTLKTKTDGQCSLNVPFVGFYGDWDAAPLLDYDCYEIAEFEKDTSYTDETRPQAQIFPTQAFASYFNEKYYMPLGTFAYLQDENASQHIYTDVDHAAISRYNEYYGPNQLGNYLTTDSVKALFAGVLRNAEIVTYDLYDADTGELIKKDNVYRVNKSYAGGGTAVPSQVLLELKPEELGLEANGKYQLNFNFYRTVDDMDDPAKQDNTFSMVFYVDYEAPILMDSRIRYKTEKVDNKETQRIYLDIDVYDNHYAQAVMLCYAENPDDVENTKITLATDYITPVYNANKNGTTTVSIEVTDIIDQYRNNLYVQIDDYALNYNVYSLSFSNCNAANLPTSFKVAADPKIQEVNGEKTLTLGVNETFKVKLDYEGDANLSNFSWEARPRSVVDVKNGEIFAVGKGDATVTITGAKGATQKLKVHVEDSNKTLNLPSISFGAIKDKDECLVKAIGTVEVSAGKNFKLTVITDPWYYPANKLKIYWSSTKEDIATVDQNGNVTTYDKEGTTTIKAQLLDANGKVTLNSATVSLSVQEPFTINGTTLIDYNGTGGDIVLPDDKNIMTIGEEAFKDNDNITSVVIPKTVTQINERAFLNCTKLKAVYFIQKEPLEIPDSKLSVILQNAFDGCTALETVDLSNVKVITVYHQAFFGCTALKEVKAMNKIGTAGNQAFFGCTSLESADITGLHTAGNQVFQGCSNLKTIKTDKYTALGFGMFADCVALGSADINCATVGSGAFYNCTSLNTVNFGKADGEKLDFVVGANAFDGCSSLATVNLNGNKIISLGDQAFANCYELKELNLSLDGVDLGDSVFENTPVKLSADGDAIYSGTTLVMAPKEIGADFAIKEGTTAIGDYAFSDSNFSVNSFTLPATITSIGEGSFAHVNLKEINLPAGITAIPDYAFYGAEYLESITIPATVESIGVSAFEGCGALVNVNFEGTALKKIGDTAFANCASIEEIVLPDGASEMGSRVFYGCLSLRTVALPSLTKLGDYTFWLCISLESASFGENSTASGNYTFFPGGDYNIDGELIAVYQTKLETVNLGTSMKVLGDSVFDYCTQLKSINLYNITEVGDYAFANCSALAEVNGIEKLVIIGDGAFAGCAAFSGSLNLENAEVIGDEAFWISDVRSYTYVNVPKVKSIGASAFFGGNMSSINLPASLTEVGAAAFSNSITLTEIKVDGGNAKFFAEDGVLYRIISDGKYELMAYPSAKKADSYTVKEGTVAIGNLSFTYLAENALPKVVIPYSVKTIGVGAFYASGITDFVFEGAVAPSLLNEYYDLVKTYGSNFTMFNSLFYENFETAILEYADTGTPNMNSPDLKVSRLKISYPSNGVGYDNYVFASYFTGKTVTAEVLDTQTRELKDLIESFATAETVSGWNTLEVNEDNTAMVAAFAEDVKRAHGIYNGITGEKQLELLGADNVTKLLNIESALKSVKQRFGIQTKAVSLTVSPDSTHKTVYKAGEKFDMTGLKLIVTYDDYSSEEADMSKITLVTDKALEPVIDIYVVVSGYGVSVQVAIEVEDNGTTNGETGNGTEFNATTLIIVLCVVGGVLVAAAVVTVVLLMKKGVIGGKSKKAEPVEANEEQPAETNGEQTSEAEETPDGEGTAADVTENQEETSKNESDFKEEE